VGTIRLTSLPTRGGADHEVGVLQASPQLRAGGGVAAEGDADLGQRHPPPPAGQAGHGRRPRLGRTVPARRRRAWAPSSARTWAGVANPGRRPPARCAGRRARCHAAVPTRAAATASAAMAAAVAQYPSAPGTWEPGGQAAPGCPGRESTPAATDSAPLPPTPGSRPVARAAASSPAAHSHPILSEPRSFLLGSLRLMPTPPLLGLLAATTGSTGNWFGNGLGSSCGISGPHDPDPNLVRDRSWEVHWDIPTARSSPLVTAIATILWTAGSPSPAATSGCRYPRPEGHQ